MKKTMALFIMAIAIDVTVKRKGAGNVHGEDLDTADQYTETLNTANIVRVAEHPDDAADSLIEYKDGSFENTIYKVDETQADLLTAINT